MKKINLLIISALLIGGTVVSSCEKTKISPSQSSKTKDIETSLKIAEGHNELLEKYYSNKTNNAPKKYSDLNGFMEEKIYLLNSLVDNEKYGKPLPSEVIQQQNKALKKLTNAKENGGLDYDVFSSILIDELLASQEISNELFIDLKIICDLGNSTNGYSREYVINYVNTTFKSKEYNSIKDVKIQKTFIAVLNHSYEFWSNKSSTSKLKEGSGVILADAAGALYGGLLGPIGSIVYGAAFSIIANEQ